MCQSCGRWIGSRSARPRVARIARAMRGAAHPSSIYRAIVVAGAPQPRTVHCAAYPHASNWISAAAAPIVAKKRGGTSCCLLHREQVPFFGYSLQGVQATIGEFDAGACDEVFDRTGNYYFIWIGRRRDARSDVYGDASDVAADQLAFARMQPGSDL